jgi:rubredoxin
MSSPAPEAQPFKMWRCLACGLIYDEAEGWPDDGIPPKTRWADIPAGWCCPECGARKDDFEMVEF